MTRADDVIYFVSLFASTRNTTLYFLLHTALSFWILPILLVPWLLSALVLCFVTAVRFYVINRPAACRIPHDTGAVLITGASAGFGRLAALRIASQGVPVFAGVRKQADADELRQAAGRNASLIRPLILDVTREDQIAAAVNEVSASLARESRQLVAVVNNAGYGQAGDLADIPLAVFQRQIDTNVTGSLRVSQMFLPLLRTAASANAAAGRPSARLIFVSSVGGRTTVPHEASYHMSKYAVEAMTDGFRMELASANIDVCVVEPGGFKTQFANTLLSSAGADAGSDKVRALASAFMNKMPDPEPVVRMYVQACFERSPLPRYIVGVDAAFVIHYFLQLPDTISDFVKRKALGS